MTPSSFVPVPSVQRYSLTSAHSDDLVPLDSVSGIQVSLWDIDAAREREAAQTRQIIARLKGTR